MRELPHGHHLARVVARVRFVVRVIVLALGVGFLPSFGRLILDCVEVQQR